MQYAAKAAPHKAVSRDMSRPILTRVILYVPKKPRGKNAPWTGHLTATDSYQAIKIPVRFDELDEPVPGTYAIDPAAFKVKSPVQPTIRAAEGAGNHLVLRIGELRFPLEQDKGQPIDFDKLVPERETSFEIGFNIDVLRAAIEGLGSKTVAIRFTLDEAGDPSNLRPMLVRPINEDGDDGRIALVMPMRISR